ncbi:condensation domain-containing protein, partial [Methylosinus sp. Sm6]|uniref:condensation domain-containing protein n=1 Tax=Methylosinus sp. Sm6 TaxID=2866948 RepID=UPI001C999B9A
FFVNTLALRADLSGRPSFVALLKRVRDMTLGAQAHQDAPFERLVEELRPVRDMSRSPLFQAMFVLQNAPSRELTLPGLRIEALTTPSVTSKFDLTLALAESEDGLKGGFEYATSLFEAATIARLAEHYSLLLKGIVAHPQERIDALALLGEAERRRLVVELNETSAPYPDLRLHEMFSAQAARRPDAIAMRFEGNDLTYGELNARANRLARRLRRLGVAAESLVGV